jgi:hypothetical protein
MNTNAVSMTVNASSLMNRIKRFAAWVEVKYAISLTDLGLMQMSTHHLVARCLRASKSC